MSHTPNRLFGPRQQPLAQLSDEELLAEVSRRREARGAKGPAPTTVGPLPPKPLPPLPQRPRQVRQWLANLELDENADLAAVEAAFAHLQQRYAPACKAADPKRRAAAELLLNGLRAAHNGLRAYLLQENA